MAMPSLYRVPKRDPRVAPGFLEWGRLRFTRGFPVSSERSRAPENSTALGVTL